MQRASGEVQSLLQLMTDSAHLRGARVGVLTHAAFDWVATVLGTCRAGGTAVLLSNKHSPAELRYAIESVGCSVVVTTPDFANAAAAAVEDLEDLRAVLVVNPMQADAPIEATRLQQALQLPNAPLPADGRRTLAMSEEERLPVHAQPPPLGADEVLGNTPATIVFTSGTTGRPKGVLMTHTNLYSNITAMQKEWAWSAEDRVVNILPLHHIHGAFNVVLTALASGAPCEMHMGFDAATVFDR